MNPWPSLALSEWRRRHTCQDDRNQHEDADARRTSHKRGHIRSREFVAANQAWLAFCPVRRASIPTITAAL
jgi:hypothetical protein